jgi:uncharacterized membrane protein (UPF0127 family)
MAWLTRDGEVLASVEVADSMSARLKGLAGRDQLEGALLLRPPLVLHTIGLPFAVDVAFCDADLKVLTTVWLNRWRIALPRSIARRLVVAEAGAFERWRLTVGDRLEVKGS